MIDGKNVWKFEDFEAPEFKRPENLLPSDYTLREDIVNIVANNLEAAQLAFNKINANVEAEEEIRKKYKKLSN